MGRNTKEGPDSLFCSELVAYVYQGVGLLKKFSDGGTIPNEFSPCDFSSDFSIKHPLLKGELEKEVMFGFPPEKVHASTEHHAHPKRVTARKNQKHFRDHFGRFARNPHPQPHPEQS